MVMYLMLCFLDGVGVAIWLSLLPRLLGVGVFTGAAAAAATPPAGVDTVEPLDGDRVDLGSESGSTCNSSHRLSIHIHFYYLFN